MPSRPPGGHYFFTNNALAGILIVIMPSPLVGTINLRVLPAYAKVVPANEHYAG